MNIGKIGIWTSYRRFGIDRAGEAAKLAEQLGYGTWWVGSSPHVPDIRPVLEATSTLVAATGILNVWSNDPGETAAADAALRAEFPGRFMLGIGIGHPEATSDYRRPLTTMRAFLDGLDASPTPPPVDERCLAALGPKMLDLAGQDTAGTHTYFVPVAHTRFARERLGSGKLVAPEVACVVDTDPVRAKAVAREYAKLYLGLRNYTHNLFEFGFTDGDLADGGSDRLIDAVIPQGSAEQIAEVVRAHLDAGADHVCLQPLGEEGIPRRSWMALAKVLIDQQYTEQILSVFASRDKAAGTDVVRSMAERAGATITEVEGSHVIMISRPDVVADVIKTATVAVSRPVAATGV